MKKVVLDTSEFKKKYFLGIGKTFVENSELSVLFLKNPWPA